MFRKMRSGDELGQAVYGELPNWPEGAGFNVMSKDPILLKTQVIGRTDQIR
jgi:hypothetical protein